MTSPCLNCVERSSECHGRCEKYNYWLLKKSEQKEKEQKAKQKYKLGIPYTLHKRRL